MRQMSTILDSHQIGMILEAEEVESSSPQDAEWAAVKRYTKIEFALLREMVGDDALFGECARFLKMMVERAEDCDGYMETDN